MKNFSYTIKDEVGIHARPAGNLAKLAKTFSSTITLEKDGKSVNVTKLMMLMGMGIKCGDTVNFTIEGEDEEIAAKEIEAFMTANL
jgi:phosphocarrier protein